MEDLLSGVNSKTKEDREEIEEVQLVRKLRQAKGEVKGGLGFVCSHSRSQIGNSSLNGNSKS